MCICISYKRKDQSFQSITGTLAKIPEGGTLHGLSTVVKDYYGHVSCDCVILDNEG